MTRPKLLFLATEDWFVRSHFMPMVNRAVEEGYDVVVAARKTEIENNETASGPSRVRWIAAPFERGSFAPVGLWREAAFVRELFKGEAPDLVHAIALKPIALTLLADWGAKTSARIFALTGRGYIDARKSALSGMLGRLLAGAMQGRVASGRAILAVENVDDRHWVESGLPLPNDRVVLFPGAGVDTDKFKPAPNLESPPIVVGVAARLVWSKGVGVAVDAVSQLRAQGMALELHIAGAPDPANPRAIDEPNLARWRGTPGVRLLGRLEDVNAFWAGVHIACVPSLGGEGLPRTLLEAASCARAIVASRVQGCVDFVEDGVNGLLAAPNDSAELANRLRTLAESPDLRARLGRAARARVVAGYTVRHAADCAAEAWRRALSSA